MKSVVNSWNEWDPLQEIIVGSVRGAVETGFEPAFSPYFQTDQHDPTTLSRPIPGPVIDDAERQMDNFATLLTRLGITVRRPDPVDHSIASKTPDWEIAGGHANACPRDTLLVIGDEIIEAPMTQRARYFEFRAYRSLIKEYFRGGARWANDRWSLSPGRRDTA